MGHLYPGMLDVSTDPLERLRRNSVPMWKSSNSTTCASASTPSPTPQVADRVELAREIFTLDDTVNAEDLAWGAKVSVGLDRLVRDFDLDSLAYYHRGLAGELHERLGAGMILGASLLTARGIPMAGEYELRTSIAMLAANTIGAGGSFTEIQALNFTDNVVEMGHDGPAHLKISSAEPLLRGLGVYHGKRGWGVSVEFDVQHGPVTIVRDRRGTRRQLHLHHLGGNRHARAAAGHRQHHLTGGLRRGPRPMGR